MNLIERKNFIVNFCYFLIWSVIIYLSFKFTSDYLLPFVLGLIIAYFVQKPSIVIAQKLKLSKNICAAVMSVLIYLLIFVLISVFFYLLYSQGNKLISAFLDKSVLNKKIDDALLIVSKYFDSNNQSFIIKNFTNEATNGAIEKIGNFLTKTIANVVKKAPSIMITGIITVVSTFYISKDYDRLKEFLKGFINKKIFNVLNEIKNIFFECFFRFVIGYFWLFLIAFFVLLIGLFFVNISNLFLISFLISLVDILPIFGAGIILLPWAVIEFMQFNFKKGVALTIVYTVIVVVKNFIEPKIISKQIDINPLFTLVFIFIGLKFGGIFGMLILPLFFTVAVTYFRRQVNSL